MNFTEYWSQSRSPFYSFLFTVPLFLVYEFGIWVIQSPGQPIIRNAADVLMRDFLERFGMLGLHGLGIGLLAGFVITFFLYKRTWKDVPVSGRYLGLMLAESILWGVSLYALLNAVQIGLMNGTGSRIIQQVVLSLGAGIYEELVFRVLLISGLGVVVKFLFQWQDRTKDVAAILIAAAIFSLFHFTGDFADNPTIRLFLLRFLAGIALGTIYVWRGFGITAYAHGVYDIIVLLKLTIK